MHFVGKKSVFYRKVIRLTLWVKACLDMKQCQLSCLVLFMLFVFGAFDARSQAVSSVNTFELKPMKAMSLLPVSLYIGPISNFKIVETDLRLPKPSGLMVFPQPGDRGVKVITDDSLRVVMYVNGLKMKELVRVDSVRSPFNPYRTSVNWPKAGKYMPHAFSGKYQGPQYGNLLDFLKEPEETPLQQYELFRQHPGRGDTLITHFKPSSPIKQIINETMVRKPYLAAQHWTHIPDPPKIDEDRARMNKRSVYDGFADLLKREDPETKRKIDKRQEILRPWTWGGVENIQFSQAFLENWVKGGENSVALLSDLRLNAKYKLDKVEWENNATHKVGVLKSGDNKARVNDDLIELNSKYGYRASKKWYYSGLINFKSQFFNGYKASDTNLENPLSGFMAPAYLTMAVGMDYKEGKNFTLLLLPFSSKLVMVLDTAKIDQTRYKIDADKKSDWMGGVSFVNNFKWTVSKEISLSSKMDVFYEYMTSDNQVQAEWEMILNMRINVFLSTRIATYLRYYDNESDKLQLKENLSIAFSYSF